MNYQEMSELEIARRVGDLLGVSWANLGENYNPLCIWVDGYLEVFDPITSWADAGPIAHQNKINLYFSNNENMAEHTQTGKESISCTDYNPCRAICIVFLMMKGGE